MSLRPILLAILISTTALAALTPQAQAEDPPAAVCPPSSAPGVLSSGVAIVGSDPSTASSDDCHFVFNVPPGSLAKQLRVALATTANHDLFVKKLVPAVATPYICSAVTASDTADTCTAAWPLSVDVYYVRVSRIGAAVSDFSLTAFYEDAPASGCSLGHTITQLSEGVAQAFTTEGAVGSRCYFRLDPAATADLARFASTTTVTGGWALYVKDGDVPSTVSGDSTCSHIPLTTSLRTCAGYLPVAGVPTYAMFIRVLAGAAGGTSVVGSSVNGCSLGRGVQDIVAGSVSPTLSTDITARCIVKFQPSGPESLAKMVLTPTAAMNLYLKNGAPPSTTVFDCSSVLTGTAVDTCSLRHGGQAVYGMVIRSAAGTAVNGFTLATSQVEGCTTLGPGLTVLANNLPATGGLANEIDAACRFVFSPAAEEATARLSVLPSVAGATSTLYVKRGSEPTTTSFDCSAAATSAAAGVCDLENLGGDVYGLVRRTASSGDFTVTALAFSPCSLGGGDVVAVPGTPIVGALTEAAGGACRFKVDLPAGSGDAIGFDLQPVSGDFDLYVRKGARPTTAVFDCKSSALDAAAESCLSVLDAGTYYAMVQRVSGSGEFSLTASSISSCSLGPAASVLEKGVAASGSLIDAAGAKCYFAFTPGHPLADPLRPADDIVKLALASADSSNFDLYLRKGAVPTTTTRDCQSVLAAGSVDACELVVGDGSVYYALVRRVSGSGPFSLVATTSSGCSLGSGYHALPNGLEVKAQTRALTGAKCFFSLPSGARDDLLSFLQTTDPAAGLTAFSLVLARDGAPGVAATQCSGTSFHFAASGLVLSQAAQCDLLLEDGLPHTWYASVARASGTAGVPSNLTLKGSSVVIPTLQPGIAQLGHVDTGTVQYWKVVLPEGATFLDIQTAGDPSNLGCSLGSQINSNIALACTLLPFPTLIGCAVAAGYGVSCDDTEAGAEELCVAQTGDAATCAQAEAARQQACALLEAQVPGTCAGSNGSVSGACGLVNGQTGDATCDPASTSVKLTEIDLLVRHRLGLPTSAVHDCRSADAGAIERCLFSGTVRDAHDNVTEPARGDLNEAIADLLGSVEGNRTALDEALAQLEAAIAEGRTGLLEPLWALIRELVFGLLGIDPGALPATPGVPAAPGSPGVVVPDQTDALPLPGPGKYFIAVRGPIDLASSLFYKGGDYAIVALHDAIEAPSRDDVDEQFASILDRLDEGLEAQCSASLEQCAAALDALRGLCSTAVPEGWSTCPWVGSFAGTSLADGCAAVLTGWAICDAMVDPPALDPAATCDSALPGWGACDLVAEQESQLEAFLASLPAIALPGPGGPAPPEVPGGPELPGEVPVGNPIDAWLLGSLSPFA